MSGPDSPTTSSESSGTSHSLLRRVKEQDATAWRRLVDLYTPLVCYWCRRAQLRQEDTEEVTQETFRAVHASIADFRHEKPSDTFRGWLRVIVANKIRNLYRQKNRVPDAVGGSEAMRHIEQLPEAIDRDETGAVNALYQRAMHLIEDKFQPQTWQAFVLVVIDGLSTEVAAERLGTTPGAVRTARWRVLRELRVQLGDME